MDWQEAFDGAYLGYAFYFLDDYPTEDEACKKQILQLTHEIVYAVGRLSGDYIDRPPYVPGAKKPEAS